VFRTIGDQPGLWEAILPVELQVLPCELARVDALLDDPAFFAPFVPLFDLRMGRPSTPMETYLRMMFLKFRYRAGLREPVPGGNRFDYLAPVLPDPAGWQGSASDDVDEADHPLRRSCRCRMNEALLAKAAEAKLLRSSRLRADTTVVCADVAYPTNSGLLAKAIRRIAATGRRIQAAGGAVCTRVRDRSRSAGRRAHGIAAKLSHPGFRTALSLCVMPPGWRRRLERSRRLRLRPVKCGRGDA
jgi:IS5 family transposase